MDLATVVTAVAGVLVLTFTWRGWRLGLVRRVVELAGLVLSFLAATRLAPLWSGDVADASGLDPRWAALGTWIVLFLAGLVLTRLLAWLISRTVQVSLAGWLDRLGGAVCGLLIGTVLASLLLVAIGSLPGAADLRRGLLRRPVSRVLYAAAPTLYAGFRALGGREEGIWQRVGEGLRGQLRAARDAVDEAADRAEDR